MAHTKMRWLAYSSAAAAAAQSAYRLPKVAARPRSKDCPIGLLSIAAGRLSPNAKRDRSIWFASRSGARSATDPATSPSKAFGRECGEGDRSLGSSVTGEWRLYPHISLAALSNGRLRDFAAAQVKILRVKVVANRISQPPRSATCHCPGTSSSSMGRIEGILSMLSTQSTTWRLAALLRTPSAQR
jgi:hypothetical protein